jgi:hypothetical protein
MHRRITGAERSSLRVFMDFLLWASIVGRLSEDLGRLAKGFGGLRDLSYRSSTTFFRLRFSGLASAYDSLRGKVEALGNAVS